MRRLFFSLTLSSLSVIFSGQPVQARILPSFRFAPVDSVGIEKKDGKRYILHRVDEGQTLFAIARRYKRSVAEIKAANPDLKDAVRYDQLIRIPVPNESITRKEAKAMDKAIRKQEKEERRAEKAEEKSEKSTATAKPEKPVSKKTPDTGKNDPARAGIHVVEPGQTLYSLANRYGVTQEDIRRWNGLPGNNVLIGQALIVSEKAYIVRSPSPAPRTPTDRSPEGRTPEGRTPEGRTPEGKAETRPESKSATRTPEPKPATPRPTDRSPEGRTPTDHSLSETRPTEAKPAEPKPERKTTSEPAGSPHTPPTTPAKAPEPEIESPSPGNDAPMPTRGRQISASGVAEVIEGTGGSGKYLALHRTAPIGTLVQVRNEFNNQSLWVKVIGRLPDTGVNDKILVKLSSQAFAKLSPVDRRFRAEVSYIAP